jgi:hypothetical protein
MSVGNSLLGLSIKPMRRATIPCILGLLLVAAPLAAAAERTCDHCGCHACCKRVCVCKPIEKEVVKICWEVKCEDVCVPGCSELCQECCKEDDCGRWYYGIWKPGCAKIKTRHIPVKKEVIRKVPGFEWVVEYRCPNCCNAPCKSPAAAEDATAIDETPPRELAELQKRPAR